MGSRCSWAVGVGDVVGGPAYPVARADLMGTVTRVISQATTACFHPTLSCPSRQEEGIDLPLPPTSPASRGVPASPFLPASYPSQRRLLSPARRWFSRGRMVL